MEEITKSLLDMCAKSTTQNKHFLYQNNSTVPMENPAHAQYPEIGGQYPIVQQVDIEKSDGLNLIRGATEKTELYEIKIVGGTAPPLDVNYHISLDRGTTKFKVVASDREGKLGGVLWRLIAKDNSSNAV
ncbi:MAG: hypothetical protein J7647_32145 [Cyanobacteria bacterium SBLK]|nr:hypothetical protein [Cyanobacteria bacterium SBLK]